MANRWDVKPTGEVVLDKIMAWLESSKSDLICWVIIAFAVLMMVGQIIRFVVTN